MDLQGWEASETTHGPETLGAVAADPTFSKSVNSGKKEDVSRVMTANGYIPVTQEPQGEEVQQEMEKEPTV